MFGTPIEWGKYDGRITMSEHEINHLIQRHLDAHYTRNGMHLEYTLDFGQLSLLFDVCLN
ncbi:hypothetical protein EBZ35_03580 [bacterium]|nr:hypothetical protein [bacterium]